jgi:hypothetical protein
MRKVQMAGRQRELRQQDQHGEPGQERNFRPAGASQCEISEGKRDSHCLEKRQTCGRGRIGDRVRLGLSLAA